MLMWLSDPLFWKEQFIELIRQRSFCNMYVCNFSFVPHFAFEDIILALIILVPDHLVLIVPVPDHCLHLIFMSRNHGMIFLKVL